MITCERQIKITSKGKNPIDFMPLCTFLKQNGIGTHEIMFENAAGIRNSVVLLAITNCVFSQA
jgi:hypothetical protein